MIVTVTLNPALDVSGRCDAVRPGPKLRVEGVTTEPGGGGINVARAVRALGGAVQALAVLGGATGAQLAALLADEGVALTVIPGPGETRQSLSVTDADRAQWRFVLPGPPAPDAAALTAAIAAAAPMGALVVLSGSQPPGLADDFALTLATALPGRRGVGLCWIHPALHWWRRWPGTACTPCAWTGPRPKAPLATACRSRRIPANSVADWWRRAWHRW